MPSPTTIQWLLTSLKQPVQKYKNVLLPGCANLDWAELIAYADRHGLTPLLYHQLQSDAKLWAAVPSSAQGQLEQCYLYNAQRNLLLYHQFLKLIQLLKQDGISVIILKGIYLAHAVYRDRALRPMLDVDILVRPRDIIRVESALQTLGYQLSDWKHREWCLKNHYHLAYVHPELGVHMEVHWHIQRTDAPYPVEIDELWHHAQPITIAGTELLGLSPEHLLVYQCLHIAKHGFGVGLRPFYDLAAILTRYRGQIDWQTVRTVAERWRLDKAVTLSLHFATELFDGVSESVMNKVNMEKVDGKILETAREQIFTFGSITPRMSPEFLRMWKGEQQGNKIVQLLRRIFVSRDLLASVYHQSPNSWRVYLYYPVRIVYLLARYPTLIGQLVRRDQATLAWVEESDRVDTLHKWLVT